MGVSNTVDGDSGRDRVTSPLPSSSCSLAPCAFFRLPGFETFPYFSCKSSAAMSRWRGSCLDFCDGFSERGMRSHRNRIGWGEQICSDAGAAYPVGLSFSLSSAVISVPFRFFKRRAITGGRNTAPFSSPTLLPSQHGLFVRTICQSCLSYLLPVY